MAELVEPTPPQRAAASTRRILTVLARDLRVSPRSPVILMAVVMPVLITLVVNTVFGGLLQAPPSLGVAAPAASGVVAAAGEVTGVDVTIMDSPDAAAAAVASGDLSAAIILPPGPLQQDLDGDLAAGRPVVVRYLVAGDTLAVDRAVLSATVNEMLRTAAGGEPALSITVETVGDDEFVPLADRMLPMMVIYAIMIAGLFVPAATLLDERTAGTLDAVLHTPMRMGEVLAAKGIFAGVLAMLLGVVTLAINGVLTGDVLGLGVALLSGTVMLVMLGLLLGMWTKDMASLYTWIKAGGILIILPALVLMFPEIPPWIGKVVPTYYFLGPIFDLTVSGQTLSGVWPSLGVAALISLALVPVVVWSARQVTDRRRRG